MNAAMERGNRLETEALECIKSDLGPPDRNIKPCFAIHPEYDFISVSFDGVDHENKYVVEIKCPNNVWNFTSVFENGIQDYYYPQVQWQLMVANALWDINTAFFCSYYPDGAYIADRYEFKETLKTLCRKTVDYDYKYCQEILKVAKIFNKFVTYDYWDFEEYEEILNGFYSNTQHKLNTSISA